MARMMRLGVGFVFTQIGIVANVLEAGLVKDSVTHGSAKHARQGGKGVNNAVSTVTG